jgi:cobalamin biosynthesis protein CobT
MKDFYDRLQSNDWLGRDMTTYTYHSSKKRKGWESSLNEGSAYSSYLVNLGKRNLPTKRKLSLTHYLASSVVSRMNPRKQRIRVNFDSANSYTDAKTMVAVNISSLTGDFDFDTVNHAIDPVLGFTVHEMAHVLYTDTSIQEKYFHLIEDANEKRIKNMLYQLLEDERIEAKVAKAYVGYSRYIEKAKEYAFVRSYTKQTHFNEVSEFLEAFFYLMRFPKKLERDLANKYEAELTEVIDILTPYPQEVKEIMTAIDKIYDVLSKFIEKEEDEQDDEGNSDESGDAEGGQSDDNNEGGDSNPSSGQSDTDPDEQGDNEGGNDGDSQENGDGEGEENDQSSGNGSDDFRDDDTDSSDSGSEPDSSRQTSAEELREQLEEVLKNIEEQQNQGVKEDETQEDILRDLADGDPWGSVEDLKEVLAQLDNEAGKDNDKEAKSACAEFPDMIDSGVLELKTEWVNKVDSNDFYSRNLYDESLARVGQYAASLRAKIMQLNRAVDVMLTNLAEGSFNQDDLVPALLGSKNVYMEQHRIVNRGAAVILLTDESGSMSWSAGNSGRQRIEVARDVAVMFERALDGVNNVDFFCYGHSTSTNYVGGEDATLMRSYFEGRKKGDKYSLGAIKARDTNRDGHAVLEAVARTREQIGHDTPIVLFVLSDGLPTAGTPDGYTPVEYNKYAVELVKNKYNTTSVHLAVEKIEAGYEDVFDLTVDLTDSADFTRDIGEILKRVIMKQQMPITL